MPKSRSFKLSKFSLFYTDYNMIEIIILHAFHVFLFQLSMLVCLGASLSVWGDRLSLWMKMGLVGGAWVLAGGVNTAAIVLKTLPR